MDVPWCERSTRKNTSSCGEWSTFLCYKQLKMHQEKAYYPMFMFHEDCSDLTEPSHVTHDSHDARTHFSREGALPADSWGCFPIGTEGFVIFEACFFHHITIDNFYGFIQERQQGILE
jgi:hypothetical protein